MEVSERDECIHWVAKDVDRFTHDCECLYKNQSWFGIALCGDYSSCVVACKNCNIISH